MVTRDNFLPRIHLFLTGYPLCNFDTSTANNEERVATCSLSNNVCTSRIKLLQNTHGHTWNMYKILSILTTSNTSAIFANTSLFRLCNSGTDLRKLILSCSLCSPVLIIICWKTFLSSTHTRQSETAESMNRLLVNFISYSINNYSKLNEYSLYTYYTK